MKSLAWEKLIKHCQTSGTCPCARGELNWRTKSEPSSGIQPNSRTTEPGNQDTHQLGADNQDEQLQGQANTQAQKPKS
jgi:hypothetical protein